LPKGGFAIIVLFMHQFVFAFIPGRIVFGSDQESRPEPAPRTQAAA
jgi:hypothetical protein